MTSTGGIIRLCGVSCSHPISLLYKFQNVVIIINELFFQTSNLYHTIFVLSKVKRKMIIQKIVEFASIYFVHRDSDCKISLMIFPVVNSSFEEIFNCYILNSIHCISFSRSCLTICKNGDNTLIEYQVKNRTNLIKV